MARSVEKEAKTVDEAIALALEELGVEQEDADIEILNPDKVIANIAKGGSLVMEMTVGNGRGYVKSDDNKKLLSDKKVEEKPSETEEKIETVDSTDSDN